MAEFLNTVRRKSSAMFGALTTKRSSSSGSSFGGPTRRGSVTLEDENTHAVEFLDGPMGLKMNFVLSKEMFVVLGEHDVSFITAKKNVLAVPYELIPKWSASSDNIITFQYKKKEEGEVFEITMKAASKEATDTILDALDKQVAEIVVFKGMAPDMPAALSLLKSHRSVSTTSM